jgi:hypothetical protein
MPALQTTAVAGRVPHDDADLLRRLAAIRGVTLCRLVGEVLSAHVKANAARPR